MQKQFMQNNSCNACKTKAQQELNKADENCEIKQQFLRTVTFTSVTEKQQKLKTFMVAPQQIIKKKIKVRGLHITYKNCQVLQYGWH